ncbi:MAG: VWA-like domain-containing protein [Roseburia sp.]
MAHLQTQTEWEEEMSVKILDFVRNELYLELRFLDVALSALVPKAESTLSTMATDGKYLFYSSEQILRVFQKNAKYLDRCFLHTVLHCIFFHLWTRGERDITLWNLACDIAVEYTIDGMGKNCTKRILSWQRQKCYEELETAKKGISAAVIYRMLQKKEKEEIEKLVYEFYTDDHRYWPRKEETQKPEQQILQKNWNKIARQTKMERESRGDEQKDGEELFAAQIKAERSRRSYRDFLKKFSVLREEMHADPDEFDMNYYSYGLRLYGNMPLIEPLESREVKKIQEFVVVVDTSYSTSGELVKNFLKETFTILTQENSFFRDCRIRIIQCDEKVQMDEEVRSVEELEILLEKFTIVGGGGTDFRPAFAYVNELIEQGAFRNLCGLLYFTDGKGIYPKKKPEYKTAFLFLEDYEDGLVPPWAIRLKLEPEELMR